MTLTKRLSLVAALVAVFALAAAAVTLSSQLTSASSPTPTGEAARLDDGQDLLPQAGITIDQAIAVAQAAVADPTASDGDGETNDDANVAGDPAGPNDETNDGADDAADPNHTDDEAEDTADSEADGETNDGADDSPADGVVGEIDLEDYNGTLAFNVEIGAHDVKVDAATGDVLGMGSD